MTSLNAVARDALTTLVKGEAMRSEGGWLAAGRLFADAAVEPLQRNDLVERCGERLRINACGRGWLARAERADAPNRLMGTKRLAPRDAVDKLNVEVNRAENPLGWLAKRGHVDERQLAASERLRTDFRMAQLGARVTMNWTGMPARGLASAGGIDAGSSQIAAKRRFDEAVAAVGSGLSDILWRTVCNDEGLEAAERGLGWPARSGKLVLSLALNRLADHYHC